MEYGKFQSMSLMLPALLKADCDVIDCNQFPYFPCFAGKVASIVKRKPLVVTWLEVWDTYWRDYLGLIRGSIGRIVERLTMRLADGIVAISYKTRDDLIRCHVKPERIDVIPVGIDLERITIQRVFEQADGDKALAGKMLGISRATLYRKLKRYNIAFRTAEKVLAHTAP